MHPLAHPLISIITGIPGQDQDRLEVLVLSGNTIRYTHPIHSHPINTHPINTNTSSRQPLYYLSTHPLNPPSQPTLSTHSLVLPLTLPQSPCSPISGDVSRLIAHMLVHNTTVHKLYLDHTNIGPVGEKNIAAGIASSKCCGLQVPPSLPFPPRCPFTCPFITPTLSTLPYHTLLTPPSPPPSPPLITGVDRV